MKIDKRSLFEANKHAYKLGIEITEIEKELEQKEKLLSEEIRSIVNEISALHVNKRVKEEVVDSIKSKLKQYENELYKMELVLQASMGKILFHVDTKGLGDEIVFVFDGRTVQKYRDNIPVEDTRWSKEGKKVEYSFLNLIDKIYVLHENGDFAVYENIEKSHEIPQYNSDNVICNIMELS